MSLHKFSPKFNSMELSDKIGRCQETYKIYRIEHSKEITSFDRIKFSEGVALGTCLKR